MRVHFLFILIVPLRNLVVAHARSIDSDKLLTYQKSLLPAAESIAGPSFPLPFLVCPCVKAKPRIFGDAGPSTPSVGYLLPWEDNKT